MKRLFYAIQLIVLTFGFNVTVKGQSWKLCEMSSDDFELGGDLNWSFEQLTYNSNNGSFCLAFKNCDENNASNYVDIYQPERVGGQLFQDINKDMEIAGEFTKALTLRKGWYNAEWTEPSRSEANHKFVYVARADMLNNWIEVCGNKEYNAVISFTATEDGFYQVNGSLIRQDGANLKALKLIPRFRPEGTEMLDEQLDMGLAFPFGEGGAVIEGAENTRLMDGYNQRYTAQLPTDFSFATRMKEGDILTFEVSYQEQTTSTWPRDYYPRVFYRQLDITLVDEATARQNEQLVDPYDETVLQGLNDKIKEYEDSFAKCEAGSNPGQFTQDALDRFEYEFGEIVADINYGMANALNISYYYQQMEDAWQKLMRAMVRVDVDAKGNYKLITSTGEPATEDVEIWANKDAFAANEDSPWGFYGRVVSTGVFEKFANHDANNKSGESAWYKSGGQWYYITDQGAMHPLTDRAPGILFTAQADGIYRFDLSAYRPNPNAKLENPLYFRCYVLPNGMQSVQSEQAVLSKQYGSVKNDGAEGKAPIYLAFYANLKAGDRVFMEIDAYTAGNIGSAGTQLLNLTACRFVSENEPITLADALDSGELVVNPYVAGDASTLLATIAEAEALLALVNDNIGDEDGQYNDIYHAQLLDALEEAKGLIEDAETMEITQTRFDEMNYRLRGIYESLEKSKVPYHLHVSGEYSICIAETGKYLTQNNRSDTGTHFYANFLDAEGVVKDAARFEDWEPEDYNWTFTIEPVKDDERYVHMYGTTGWLTADAYIETRAVTSADKYTFELLVESPGDELFAVRRPDGLYWGTSMNWAAPYNKIQTSKEPLYVFKLTQDTPTGIRRMENGEWKMDNGKWRTENGQWYDLSGRSVSASTALPKGIYVKNGRKYIVK